MRAITKKIRQELKNLNVEFVSIRYESFAGGNAVNIKLHEKYSYAEKRAVEKILDKKFVYGDFDGSIDYYEYRKNLERDENGSVFWENYVKYIGVF